MTGPQAGFERRIHGALDAAPSRIPVILGGCGTGRTWLLQHVRERAGRQASQYIDVERSATTPERFLQAVISSSPFAWHGAERTPVNARDAFDALLAFFDTARPAVSRAPSCSTRCSNCGRSRVSLVSVTCFATCSKRWLEAQTGSC